MTLQRKILCAASWVLTALCMATIFYFSNQTSADSAQVSLGVYSRILEVLGALLGRVVERFGHDGIRTMAHFTEYTVLGFLMSTSITFTLARRRPWFTLGLCAAYALTDEIHQIFVPGRAFQVTDLAVDTAGALLGIGVFCLLAFLVLRLRRGRADQSGASGRH